MNLPDLKADYYVLRRDLAGHEADAERLALGVQRFREQSRSKFPTWREVCFVLLRLGWSPPDAEEEGPRGRPPGPAEGQPP